MLLAWAVFLPLGVIFARRMQGASAINRDMYFKLHVLCQFIAIGLSTISFFFALSVFKGDLSRLPHHHAELGITVMVMVWTQVLLGAARPHPDAGRRRTIWEHCHHWLGRLTWVLAFATVVVGIGVLETYNRETVTGWYVALVLLVVAVFMLGEAWVQYHRRRQGSTKPIKLVHEPTGQVMNRVFVGAERGDNNGAGRVKNLQRNSSMLADNV